MKKGIRKQKNSLYWSIRYRDTSGKLREESSRSIKKRDAEALFSNIEFNGSQIVHFAPPYFNRL